MYLLEALEAECEVRRISEVREVVFPEAMMCHVFAGVGGSRDRKRG